VDSPRRQKAVGEFIRNMYENRLYDRDDFLLEHCSAELLQKLQDAYPYDTDKVQYANWLFRSGQQDIKSQEYRLTGVDYDGGWYTYSAVDYGWKFVNRVKVSFNGRKIIFTDLERVSWE